MAKIPLTEGFSLIPVGTYVFRIDKVEYKEAFGKLSITLCTQGGKKHVERFSLQNKDGSSNEGALSAFSYFAKVALNDFSAVEVDPEDLVGLYLKAEVEHTEGDSRTFTRLGNKEPADGFEDGDAPEAAQAQSSAGEGFDLDDLLGA